MISIKRLESQLSNFKENPLTLPKDNKYTQLSAFDIKRRELENRDVVDEYDKDVDYTMKNVLNGVIPRERLEKLNENIKQNDVIDSINKAVPNESLLIYNENDVIDLPEIMQKVFGNDVKGMYLYGFKNPESFFKSILLQSSFNYILKNNTEKYNEVMTFKREMAINLDTNYKKHNYKGLKFNKNNITNYLVNENSIDYQLKVYTSDYLGYNIYIFDTVEKNYYRYNTKYEDNVILILYNNVFLPVMKSDGNNKFTNDDLSKYICKMDEVFDYNTDNGSFGIPNSVLPKQEPEPEPEQVSPNEEISQEQIKSDNSKSLAVLKGKSLNELQTMASSKNISIHKTGKTGKNINKTKKELIEDLNK